MKNNIKLTFVLTLTLSLLVVSVASAAGPECPNVVTTLVDEIQLQYTQPVAVDWTSDGNMVVAFGASGPDLALQKPDGLWVYYTHPEGAWIMDMAINGRTIWMAHYWEGFAGEGAVSSFDLETETWTTYTSAEGVDTLASPDRIIATSDGTIIVASVYAATPVAVFDGDIWRGIGVANGLFAGGAGPALITHDDVVWIGQEEGVCFWNGWELSPLAMAIPIPGAGIAGLAEAPDGKIWASGEALYQIPRTGEFEEFPLEDSGFNYVAHLATDAFGRVWASKGDVAGGISIFDPCREDWVAHYEWPEILEGGWFEEVASRGDEMYALEFWSGRVFIFQPSVTQIRRIYLPITTKNH